MQKHIPTKAKAPTKAGGCARALKGSLSGCDQTQPAVPQGTDRATWGTTSKSTPADNLSPRIANVVAKLSNPQGVATTKSKSRGNLSRPPLCNPNATPAPGKGERIGKPVPKAGRRIPHLVEDNLTPKGASPMGATPRKGSFNRVLVLNQDRTPAMPCTPARARRLLSAGKAAVLRFQPFMVILKYNTQGKQPLQLKTIPGAKTAGLALTLKAKTGCKVVWSAHHPSKPELPRPAHNDNSDSAGQGTPTPKYQHGNSNEINVFRGKSVAVPRQLLADPQRTWSLKQIQQAARISSGLAFRVMNQLRTHHLVRGGNADWRLDQPQRLLQEWAAQDRLHKHATLTRYLTEHTDDLATLAAKLMHRPNLRNIAFTQWQAARIQGATENLPIVSFYAHLPLAASDIDALNLRKVLRGGNVWLFQPRTPHDWPLVQTTRKLPIVADHQIFLDLSRAGDFVPNRPDGPEQEIAQLGLEAQPALPPGPSFFQALEPVSLADFTGRAQPCLSATLSPKPRPTP